MKTYVYQLTDRFESLISDSIKEEINQSNAILIQIFSGEKIEIIQKTLKELKQYFPQSVIISTTTDGEIAQGKVLTNTTIISISTFEKTSLKIAFNNNKESYLTGKELAKEIVTEETKLIISFANGILCNGEEFLEGISSINPELMVAGGLSADNAQFKKCYVGMNENLYDTGAVAVSLNSKHLQVNNLYSFGWNAIGLKHQITKAVRNRLYTIDNIDAVSFYRKYLGDSVADQLPKTGIEFPLIIDIDGFQKARAITAKHEDGSLSFAGNISEGEYAYIGIGKVRNILSNHIKEMHNIPVESFFIYSCMARRRFIPDLIYKEIEPFAEIAPTSGFFTYGEFFTNKKPELLNQTLTAVALSESDISKTPNNFQKQKQTEVDRTFQALMHIIDVTSKELNEQTLLQETMREELAAKNNTLEVIQEMANLGSWELDLETMKISWSKISYKIHNVNPQEEPPTYLDFINMILPEDREKFISSYKKLEDGKIHSIEIKIRRTDNKIITLVESGMLIFAGKKPVKIVGTTLDITEIRMQDAILIQQSKSAQMGEMINMIAHQWRQPLNAISSAIIKLNMQSEMDILSKEEVKKTSKFIEDMTQEMSQTINDFMNFTKPTNQKEHINFHDIFEDIFKIIDTQLKNHNITINLDIEAGASVFTYKNELEHILINIISNARDALNELNNVEKNIDITIHMKNHLCIIKIADNAGGIDETIINKIFNPYFTTKDANKGTGLGLYMSKKLLQEHLNGDIFVKNKDAGAEFTIILDKNNE